MAKKIVLLLMLSLVLFNCKSVRISKKITKTLKTNFYNNQFTGLLVYNPRTKDTVISYNANKYFTPASNTKIITLFTALKILKDSIPVFKYHIKNDTIIIKGTGNPTFLHSFFKDSIALKMLQKFKKIKLLYHDFSDKKFGAGWAWEDYDAYFNVERSTFPMYGNVLTITNTNDSLEILPKVLQSNLNYLPSKFKRSSHKNDFFYNAKSKETVEIPMIIDSTLTMKLWNSILPNKVSFTKEIPKDMKTLFGIKSDSVYKRMMYVSDNFLAEQLLIMASVKRHDVFDSEVLIKDVLNNELNDLKQKPRWVDGSGLSRYNLFTPTSFVQVLEKLYQEIPRKRLFNLFPEGGKNGTLKKWYSGNLKPYIYAKSGSLGNNYSLSGYLITNSGEVLIFSFMNNHFKKKTSEIKQQMQGVFEFLRNNY